MHQKPKISATFHQWPFWLFRSPAMSPLKSKGEDRFPATATPAVVPILNGQNGQKGQNASVVRSLLDFLPWPFARQAEFGKDKNDKIALGRANCARRLPHGERVPHEVSAVCRRRCRPAEGAIDLVDTTASISQTTTPA